MKVEGKGALNRLSLLMGISYSGGANWTYIYFVKKFGHKLYIYVKNWKMCLYRLFQF